jgi:hypothetical protein
VSFAVGKRQEPGSNDPDAVVSLVGHHAAKLAAIFGRHDSGGMVRESGQNRYFMAFLYPEAR